MITLKTSDENVPRGERRRSDEAEEHVVQAVMPRGSVVIYLESTLHGGGENRRCTSPSHREYLLRDGYDGRKAIFDTYGRGGRGAVEAMRRMLGFQAHGPFLGCGPRTPTASGTRPEYALNKGRTLR